METYLKIQYVLFQIEIHAVCLHAHAYLKLYCPYCQLSIAPILCIVLLHYDTMLSLFFYMNIKTKIVVLFGMLCACDLMMSLTSVFFKTTFGFKPLFSLIPYWEQEVACHLLILCFAGEIVEVRGKLLFQSSDWNPVLANSRIMSESPLSQHSGFLFSYSLGISWVLL